MSSTDTRPADSGPSVAVIMSVHAGADPSQFAEALTSMRTQTHRNLRLFVFCDGPLQHAHEEVLARLLHTGHGQDTVVRGDRPAGLPTGLNRLIDLAMADPSIEFMARMDADDISMPQRIERQLAYLRDNPAVSIVGTWCIEFNEPNVPTFHKQLPSDAREVPRSMLFRSALAHPTVMFRRSVFERGYRYDPALLVMQDYELWSRLIVAGEVISNVPEYLLWFRVGDGFFNRRHGTRRAWDEIGLRLRFARRSGLFRLSHLPRLLALFLVRVMPSAIKRLAYKHLR